MAIATCKNIRLAAMGDDSRHFGVICRMPVWSHELVTHLGQGVPGAAVRNLPDRALVGCGFGVRRSDWIGPRRRLAAGGWRCSANGQCQQTQQDGVANPDHPIPLPYAFESTK